MNFIQLESAQKLRGGFYTERDIADFLARWVASVRPARVLEPSCGDGAFLHALARLKLADLGSVFACELDPKEAGKAKSIAAFAPHVRVEIQTGDFLRWFLWHRMGVEPFDAALGNPPFIRYQYLPDEQQRLAEKIFKQLGLPFTKHTNSWVPFVLASFALLRRGGRLAMVVPSEILHIPHAQGLRQYLSEQSKRVLILDPEEIWFGETLQGTVLLLAEKKLDPADQGLGVAVLPMANRQTLEVEPDTFVRSAQFASGATIEGKWMPVFLSAQERQLLDQMRAHKTIARFQDLASVDVGIVTGANNFFLVPDRVVDEFQLQRWAHPMFGRSEHARGLIYSKKDHQANRDAGLPGNFLWFEEEDIERLPASVRQYLAEGIRQRLHERFKCRVRSPWYKVPSVSRAPVAMLKRAHFYPRLIRNSAEAFTTDTAYRIRLFDSTQADSLVFSFVNSLTCLTAELEGRHYGGGVLELVPSEIERLLLPRVGASPSELAEADLRFRAAANGSAFLLEHDSLVLGRIGLSQGDRDILHGAWVRLRDRRLRKKRESSAEVED